MKKSKLTKEIIIEKAKKYKSRTEFQKKDYHCYNMARNKGWLDEICSHMITLNFSIPQRICKNILDQILQEESIYNSRKIVPPYELDLYYQKFNLAFEYNGKGWHEKEETIKRDNEKKKLCKEKNITLITIKERNRKYEEDIKTQIIENLTIINSITNQSISDNDVLSVIVNYKNIYSIDKLNDWNSPHHLEYLQDFIINSKCISISEFRRKHVGLCKRIDKLGLGYLFDPLRKIPKPLTNEELLAKCKEISDYSDFVQNHLNLYSKCHRRNLLDIATSHMTRKTPKFKIMSEKELLDECLKITDYSDFIKNHKNLCKRCKNRNLFDIATKHMSKEYPDKYKIMSDDELYKKCKEITDYSDFIKNHKNLYYRCINRNLLDTSTKHMINKPKRSKTMSIEELIFECQKITDYSDFFKNHFRLYDKCRYRGILDIATSHMKR